VLADTIIAAAGASASLAAVVYARKTVAESIQGRKDGGKAHREQMAELAKARQDASQQSGAQLLEMVNAGSAAANQHAVEMDDRRRMAETEAQNRRIVQLERISELVLEIVDTARAEFRDQPPPLSPGHTGSRLYGMFRRLNNALASFAALGGDVPQPVMNFAHDGPLNARNHGALLSIVGNGVDALDAIQFRITGIRQLNE
jgi:hypothetical protein